MLVPFADPLPLAAYNGSFDRVMRAYRRLYGPPLSPLVFRWITEPSFLEVCDPATGRSVSFTIRNGKYCRVRLFDPVEEAVIASLDPVHLLMMEEIDPPRFAVVRDILEGLRAAVADPGSALGSLALGELLPRSMSL